MTKNPFPLILNPQSIAIIGASRHKDKVGHQVLKNIIDSNYPGKIYPINPNTKSILHLPAYPSILDVKQPVDTAIIVTPAPLVPAIIQECHQKHISTVVVITAGFAESGPKGETLQTKLAQSFANTSIRVLGPNCLGCFSTHHRLNATFGPSLPQKGSIMLISQSGALVTGVLDWAKKMRLGLSHAVTLGNRIDIGENEALSFAASDKNTKIILVYLESFQNAPEFFSQASTISQEKPIILLKGGQSQAGQTASASHTAALATNYTLVKAFSQQTGIILTDTINHWLNTAHIFHQIKSISGDHLAIITNAGGPGVLSTDAAIKHKLHIIPFSGKTVHQLQKQLSLEHPHNPLDILGDAPPEKFVSAIETVDQDPHQHVLLAIITPQTTTKPKKTAQLIASLAPQLNKPLFVVLLGGEKMVSARAILESASIPVFTYPDQAIKLIATKIKYDSHRHKTFHYPANNPHFLSAKLKHAFDHHLHAPLTLLTAFNLLKSYKFTLPKYRIIRKITAVPAALKHVHRPAVIKTSGMDLKHKAKQGGVILNVMTVSQGRLAFRKLQPLHPYVLFQQTIAGKAEIIIGAKRDSQLGPFITVGLGGSLTDAIADRAYAFFPAQRNYIRHILKDTKAFNLLASQQLPIDPIVYAMQSLSAIMIDFPQIEEMEINPAIVTKNQLYAADIKITLNP